MKNLLRISLFVMLALVSTVTQAQQERFTMDASEGLRTFEGEITDAENQEIIITLENVQAGDTLYILAQGFDAVDPYLLITDVDLSRAYAEDDDSGNGLDATLTYQVEEDGDYVIGMVTVGGAGGYQISIGVNRPDALLSNSITQSATTERNLRMDERGAINEFSGTFQDSQEEIVVELVGVEEGDVIYVYASGSGAVDTYVFLQSFDQSEIFAEDDDSGGGFNSALSYTAESSGDYSVGLITISGIGAYRLFIGINKIGRAHV